VDGRSAGDIIGGMASPRSGEISADDKVDIDAEEEARSDEETESDEHLEEEDDKPCSSIITS